MDNNNSNIGLIIFIVLSVIGGLIYFFATESSENIAEYGAIFIVGLVVVGLFFILPKITSDNPENNNKSEDSLKIKPGCILAVVAGIAGIIGLGYVINNEEITYPVGIIGIVLIFVIVGIALYRNMKD